jgi:hypothetical protein
VKLLPSKYIPMPLVYLFIGWTCVTSLVTVVGICGFLAWQSNQYSVGVASGFPWRALGLLLLPVANWFVIMHVNAQKIFSAKSGPRMNAFLWYLTVALNLLMAARMKVYFH